MLKNPNFSWLKNPELQQILAFLSPNNKKAMVVGGAVRNAYLNKDIYDIDIATSCYPEEVITLAQQNNFRVINTGIKYGTVTIIGKNQSYEVTTLRKDIKTDGRHAKVVFTDSWAEDAKRRDFTINALYLTADGEIFDYVDGLQDLHNNYIRFIGDPYERINEDYLRILRFFRFYTYYGKGRPDKLAILACTALKNKIKFLAKERIWDEFRKILMAPQITKTMLWLRQTAILTILVPESDKWGLEHFHSLIKYETASKEKINFLLRLASIIPPNIEKVNNINIRLNLSNQQKKEYLTLWQIYTQTTLTQIEVQKNELLYNKVSPALIDSLKLRKAIAIDKKVVDANYVKQIDQLIDYFTNNIAPIFPINSQDIFNAGIKEGKNFGIIFNKLKNIWIKDNFNISREELIKILNSLSN
ncbi:CCA tRNA nucleotidyltransferase [Bartonella sp. DGB1]|uniref:CCA tRNA nucleotidyltransferase n=1 Tax=Bartonella sp. DGB1 TaxID=3239807 RepID=UPI0035246842